VKCLTAQRKKWATESSELVNIDTVDVCTACVLFIIIYVCFLFIFRIMNVELERMWKEMVLAYFGHYPSFRLEGKDCLERSMFLLSYTHRICIP
jgi:hypothetical protein